MDELLYDVDEGVALITLNRPARKNAFTLDMIDAWAKALRHSAGDDAVGAIVVTGAGDAFCSGIDLDQLRAVEDTPLAHKRMLTDRIHQVLYALDELDKPVLAGVRGAAVGAGLDMALACDMRFAGRSARMSEGYIKLGLVPGDGGCFFLTRLVGSAKALELLLSGDVVDADEALRIGMVNRVVDDDRVLHETVEFARRLAGMSRVAVGMIKRAVRHAHSGDLRANLDLVSSHMGVVMSTDEHKEILRGHIRSRRDSS